MIDKIRHIIKSIGPGFIIASVVLGPGSIAVTSSIGADYGYSFLWVILIAAIFMAIYTSMSVRFGIVNEKSFLTTISERYGRWFALVISIFSFIASSSFQFGNNLGIGIGMKGITGIDERLWPIVFTVLAIILLFWAKNLYKLLEKLMMVLVMIIILSFLLNLMLLTKPAFTEVLSGFIPQVQKDDSQLDVIAALVATTFALTGAFYQSYLVQDKGWKIDGMRKGLNDTYMGIFMLGLISVLIIITSASVLHPLGVKVNSAADMAMQLESLFGSSAKAIFSLGLCAAAFSSLMVNAVIGGGLLSDGLGLGSSMNDKAPRIFILIVLLVGMLIAVFFRGNFIYALIMSQASSLLAVPLIAISMFLMLNSKKVMGHYKNNFVQNLLATLGFILILIIVYFLYSKLTSMIGSIK